MRHILRAPLAALLLAAGLAGGLAEGDIGDIPIGTEGDIVVEFEGLGKGGDVLEASGLNDLFNNSQNPTPEPTVGPTVAPKRPPWLTSVNYSRSKINFENEIWSILTRRWGLADFQAAGFMSSIQAESGFCPYNVEGLGGSDDRGAYEFSIHDSVGFGLCQWTSSGRKAALQHYALAHGTKDLVWDFDTQMGFMAREVDQAALKATQTLYEAAEWAVMRYERPNQRYANSWPGTRYEKGLEIYRRHTGRDYEEPELSFAVKLGEGEDAPEATSVTLTPEGTAVLTVASNYYWRLTQTESTVEDWLEVQAPSFYRPELSEKCEYGCPCEGEKALTLTVAQPPEPGQTYRSTLRFEIFRGAREERTIEVSVTAE